MSLKSFCKLFVIALFIDLHSCHGLFGEIPVGDDCNRNEDCKGYPDTTFCNQLGMCWCLDHLLMIPIGDEIFCLKKAAVVGEECMHDSQCQQGELGGLSKCLPSTTNPSNLICNCTENAIHQPPNPRCYERAQKIGDGCVIDNQCKINLGSSSLCSRTTHLCECNMFSIPNAEETYCLEILDNIGDECVVSEQCKLGAPGEYSDCVVSSDPELPEGTKVCNCTEDAIYDSSTGTDECYPKMEFIGDDCIIDAQCSVNMGSLSECNGGKCTCKTEGVENGDGVFCLPKATEIGQECSEPQQCKKGAPGELSDCVESEDDPDKSICSCTDDSIQEPGKEVCLRKAQRLGDSCTHPIQCTSTLGTLSECSSEETCSCLDGQSIPNQNRDSCLKIANSLGETCIESVQCQTGTPGLLSICEDSTCQCSPDSVSEPGQDICRPRAGYIGGECQLNSQCKANLGDLSECYGGKCVCTPSGGVASGSRLRCLAIINFLGADCIEPQQCTSGDPGEHSDCVPSSVPSTTVCMCNENAVHADSKHVCHLKAEKVEDPCEIAEQCKSTLGELAECNLKICSCISGMSIPNQDKTLCLPIQDTIGDECKEDRQCHEGALGRYSACMRSDVFPYRLVCNCTDEAVPNSNGRGCHKKAYNVGDQCEITTQCTASLGGFSECSFETGAGTCQCFNGAVANTDRTRCISGGVLISKPCYDTQQCVGIPGESSICTLSNICDCLSGWVPSAQLDDCLPIRQNIGDFCTERQQCQQGEPGYHSDCIPSLSNPQIKVCNCSTGAVTEAGSNRCHLLATKVGDPCQVNIQCVSNLDHSQCLNSVCSCLSNFTASTDKSKCLPKALLGQSCVDDTQCTDVQFTYCDSTEAICLCQNGYKPHPVIANICLRMAIDIGESCAGHDSQCDNIEKAICNRINKTCDCRSDTHIPSQDGQRCLDVLWSLHQDCVEDRQCQLLNSKCLIAEEERKTCQCTKPDFVESNRTPKQCLQIITEIGKGCKDDAQCTSGIGENVVCLAGICQCPLPFVFVNGKCLKMTGSLNEPCEESLQCQVNNSECLQSNGTDKTCQCTSNQFVESADGQKCLQIIRQIGNPCEETVQCTAGISQYAECALGFCRCANSYEFYKDDCYVKARLGGECQYNEQCELGINKFAHCNDTTHTCACKSPAFAHDSSCIEFKKVGDSCTTDSECTLSILGKVLCDPTTKVCKCQNGYSSAMEDEACLSRVGVIRFRKHLLMVALSFVFVLNKIMF